MKLLFTWLRFRNHGVLWGNLERMADDAIPDELLDDAVTAGYIRCVNANYEGMAVLRPTLPSEAESLRMHEELRKAFGEASLSRYYLELLLRADAFLTFFQGNVGESEEYPLQIVGESSEAVDEFYSQMEYFSASVGVLMET